MRTLLLFLLFVIAFPGFAQKKSSDKSSGKSSYRSLMARANDALSDGDFEAALRNADLAGEQDSKSPDVPNLKGAILVKQRRYDEAAIEYNRALGLKADFLPAQLNLLELDLLQRNYASARQRVAALQKTDPKSELLPFMEVVAVAMEGDTLRATGLADQITFPGKTPSYYYAHAAILMKEGKDPKTYLENAKKYYFPAQCAYFEEILNETIAKDPQRSATIDKGEGQGSATIGNDRQ
jgi:tetratricopeptide (TPR) repeat protein